MNSDLLITTIPLLLSISLITFALLKRSKSYLQIEQFCGDIAEDVYLIEATVHNGSARVSQFIRIKDGIKGQIVGININGQKALTAEEGSVCEFLIRGKPGQINHNEKWGA